MQNNFAYGPANTNTNSKRRRRQAISQVGLYTIGQARIFYSTPCSRVADRGRYYGTNGNGLSNCVASRLAVCNALFNNRQSTPIPWVLPGSSITFSIVDTTFSSYVSLLVSAIYSLPQVAASAIATQFNLPAATQSNIGKQRLTTSLSMLNMNVFSSFSRTWLSVYRTHISISDSCCYCCSIISNYYCTIIDTSCWLDVNPSFIKKDN